jgi:MraZ protein
MHFVYSFWLKVVKSGVKWFMFYGEYDHSLDAKGRLIIPSKFREVFKEHSIGKFVLTRGLDRCLFVFTEDIWKEQEKKFKEMPFTKQESRQFNRLYFSGASEAECDKQGRILIPSYLKEYAHIADHVMIVGVSDRFEIWSYDRWKTYFGESLESFETIAEKIIE